MVSFITHQQCVKVLHSCFRQVTHVKRVDSKVMESQRCCWNVKPVRQLWSQVEAAWVFWQSIHFSLIILLPIHCTVQNFLTYCSLNVPSYHLHLSSSSIGSGLATVKAVGAIFPVMKGIVQFENQVNVWLSTQ